MSTPTDTRDENAPRPSDEQRWLGIQAQLFGGQDVHRRQWTGTESIAEVLGTVADGRMGTLVVTGRHFVRKEGKPLSAETTGVEAFGAPHVVLDSDSEGVAVLRVECGGVGGTYWLEPDTLTYLPSPAHPSDGVFVLTVAGSIEPGPGLKLTAEDAIRDPANNAEPPRWVTGGMIFACSESILREHLQEAPATTWNDFPGLHRWVARLVNTPPPRTTEEGLADPAILAHIQHAFAANRERTGRALKPLDQSDVDTIARAAIEVGLQVTVQLVNKVVGSGSPTTIHPLLKSFWARAYVDGLLPGAAAQSATIPPEVLKLYEELRSAARAAGEADLRPARDALKMRETAVHDLEEQVKEQAAALASEKRELHRAFEQLERQLEDMKEQRERDRETLEAAQHVALGDSALIAELRTQVAGLRDATATLADEAVALGRVVAQRDHTIASLRSERDERAQEAREFAIKYVESEQRFTVVAEQFQGRLDDERNAHRRTRDELTTQLTGARKRLDALEVDRDARVERAAQLEATIAANATAEAILGSELGILRQRLENLTVDLRVAQRERADLALKVSELSVPKKP